MLPLLLLLLETSAATAQTSPGATCAAVSIPDFGAEVPIATVAVGFGDDIGDSFPAVRDFLINGVSIGGSVTVPEGTIVGDISLVNVNIPAVEADLDARGVANFLDLTARLRIESGNIGVESIVGFGNDVSLQVRCNDRVGLVKKFEAEGFVVTDVDNNLQDDRMVSLTIVGAAVDSDDQVLEIVRVFNSLRVATATSSLQIDSVALVQLFSCSDACGTRGRCVIRDVMDVSSITEALTMPVQCVCEHGFFGENCEQNEYSLAGATHVVHPPACAPFMIEKCEEYEACCLEECGKLEASTIEFRCQKYKDFVKYSLKCACIVNGPGLPSPDFCDHKCGDGQPGDVGAIGFQGDNGDNGNDGGDGPDGAQGEDGHPGDVGDPGPHGDPGPDGPYGVDGGPGYPGAKGPIGAEGETGPKGGFGEEGLKGYKGDPGIWGLPGACGHNGEKGQPGDDGEKGFEGNTGPTGGQGATGDQGEPGNEGNAGIPGDGGRQGHRGPRGQDGEAGEPGGPGDPGPQGDKGHEGTYGSIGHAGEVGDKGDKGQPGGPGGRGDPGTSGGDGAPGPKGPQGPKGEKGTSEYSQDIIFHG